MISVFTYSLYFLSNLAFQSFPQIFNRLGFTTSNFEGHPKGPHRGHSHKPCIPNIPYKLNQTYEFDPNEFKSLGVALFGNTRHSSVKFARHDSNKITFDSEILVSSVKAADQIHAGSRTHDKSYGFGVKGPSIFHGHDECFTAHITVNLPNDLTEFEGIRVNVPHGEINTDFGSKLNLQRLHIDSATTNLELKGQEANQLVLRTIDGSVHVQGTISESASFYTANGDINASDIRASHIRAETATGNINVEAKDAKAIHANNVNGNVKVVVQSFQTTDVHHDSVFIKAGTFNGKAEVNVPSSYTGRFSAKTFNGHAEVSPTSEDLHFDKSRKNYKVGHKGDNTDSKSFIEAATFNGNPEIKFV